MTQYKVMVKSNCRVLEMKISVKILGVNNEGKVRFVPEFLLWRANIRARVFVDIKNRD